MKTRVFLIVALSLFSLQSLYSQGVASGVDNTAGTNAYLLPRTMLKVRVELQCEVVKRGPYARYAQKYLDAVAPLSDKTTFRIIGASLCGTDIADPSAVFVSADAPQANHTGIREQGLNLKSPLNAKYSGGVADTLFMDVLKLSPESKNTESMAAETADAIIKLRKRRFDLITGETGENVFGGGLDAAINEINRLEEEYVSLFIGKSFTEVSLREFDVIPQGDRKSVVVCRFSEQAGILPAEDITGRPIAIEFTAEGGVASTASVPASVSKSAKGVVYIRIPAMAECRITDGNRVITSEKLPVMQFGNTIEVPVISSK